METSIEETLAKLDEYSYRQEMARREQEFWKSRADGLVSQLRKWKSGYPLEVDTDETAPLELAIRNMDVVEKCYDFGIERPENLADILSSGEDLSKLGIPESALSRAREELAWFSSAISPQDKIVLEDELVVESDLDDDDEDEWSEEEWEAEDLGNPDEVDAESVLEDEDDFDDELLVDDSGFAVIGG